ncbi:MAG: hypothetical protein ACLUKQ_02350 [Peptococcaceae bacterium]
MRYLVMECHPSYAILLDEDGRLVKAANLHYQVGQTVESPVIMREQETAQVSRLPRKLGATVAAAACMMLLLLGYYQNYMAPYTAIALSINPSVLMELNKQGNVVDLEGLNEDGEDLLEGYKPESKDRLEVTDALIDRAIDMGYLSAGGRISFDIDTPDDAKFQQYGVELRSNVTEHLADRFTVTVEIKRHSTDDEGEDSDDWQKDDDESTAAPSAEPQEQKKPTAVIPVVQDDDNDDDRDEADDRDDADDVDDAQYDTDDDDSDDIADYDDKQDEIDTEWDDIDDSDDDDNDDDDDNSVQGNADDIDDTDDWDDDNGEQDSELGEEDDDE